MNALPSTDPLVHEAKSGSKHAFAALYRRECDRVYGLCLRMCCDQLLAEELTQRTFIRAWENLGRFEERSRFSTWLHRLAVNVVLGDRRSQARRIGSPPAEPTPREPVGRQRQPADVLALEKAIATLPPKARQVFVLHDVEGYRHREIAELMGVTEGTSKGQLHRARRLLREALQ